MLFGIFTQIVIWIRWLIKLIIVRKFRKFCELILQRIYFERCLLFGIEYDVVIWFHIQIIWGQFFKLYTSCANFVILIHNLWKFCYLNMHRIDIFTFKNWYIYFLIFTNFLWIFQSEFAYNCYLIFLLKLDQWFNLNSPKNHIDNFVNWFHNEFVQFWYLNMHN